MDLQKRAQDILDKIHSYGKDSEGWKEMKKEKDVTIWSKPSPDWNGVLYKGECTIATSPETVYKYVDPSPDGPRQKWDKAIKDLETIERVDERLSVIRTTTHSAFKGLISSRDFSDLAVKEENDQFISTNAAAVEHSSCPPSDSHVRGTNHPCAIICNRIPAQVGSTRVVTYIQTDLGGMLPASLVESALPSNMMNFFNSLRSQLAEDGHCQNGTSIDSLKDLKISD